MNYLQILREHDKLESFTKRLEDRAYVLHAAAAWGSDGDGFLLEKATEVIREQEKEIANLNKFVELAFQAHPNLDLDIEHVKSTRE